MDDYWLSKVHLNHRMYKKINVFEINFFSWQTTLLCVYVLSISCRELFCIADMQE